MVRFVLCTYGKALDFNEHVVICTDDIKSFIPIFSILEDFLLRAHVKLFVEERMEQWNKHGFNVDDGWRQVFKVFKQHVSIMNTKCFLAFFPAAPGCIMLQYGVFSVWCFSCEMP